MIEFIEQAALLEGCFVEIGVGVGETTKKLLQHNKKVIAIDPFEDGWNDMPKSYGQPYRLTDFIENTKSYPNLELHKLNSLSDEAQKVLQSNEIALAYVDGLQYKGAVLSDLRIVSHAKIIVVDDYNRESSISQVPAAIEEYLKTNNHRKLIIKERWAILM